MIYLDSAATSYYKPPSVPAAVLAALRRSGSPGRGSHILAAEAAETVFRCREEAAALFHMKDPAAVVFTMNATHALNIAVRSLVRPGDRVVISGWEHNAVVRPLYALGAECDVARAPLFDREAVLHAFAARLPGARAAVCTHMSNVFGFVLPAEEIAALCREANVPLILDASQSAGVMDIDFEALGAAYIAMPGHKGLMGPQGTGLLLCREPGEPLICGGTGSLSAERGMPELLPERHEAGTVNVPGIAGLRAGIAFVRSLGTEHIRRREDEQLSLLCGALSGAPGLRLFTSAKNQHSVLSLQPLHGSAERMGERLGAAGIAVRAGLHCAPLAHQSAGTFPDGTVRLSLSPFLRREELMQAADVIQKTASE